ncbi:MAG: ABC transporter permease [Acetatifactor sp.]|nr:ABC transporter permease [Acetatifactor sp.]
MKTIRDLADAFGKADRKSNLLLSGIIAMTIAVLFVIMSLAKGRILAEDIREIRENGSAATAVLQNVSEEQYDQLSELNYISNVGVVKDFGHCYRNGRYFLTCSVVEEADFLQILSPAYEDLEGNYPRAADEVMLSLHILSGLGIEKPEIGMEIPLHIMRIDWLTSEAEDIQMNFRLSGYYRDYVSSWEKLPTGYFSEALLQEQGIDSFRSSALILSDQIWMGRDQMEKRLYQDLDMGVGQNLWVVNEGSWKALQNMAGGVFVAFIETVLIVLSMNLLIYNIFSIGIDRYKKQYGLLKVIGATPKQIKGVFLLQGARLLLLGSIVGALLGSIIVRLVVPGLVTQMILAGTGSAKNLAIYSWRLLGLSVCLGALGVIAALTHCIRSIIRLSPVECLGSEGVSSVFTREYKSSKGCAIRGIAWRNLFRNRKKMLLSISALFLGIEVSLLSAVITEGLDQTHKIEQEPDFEIGVTKDVVADYIYAGAMHNETIGHELLPWELMDSIAEVAGCADEDMMKCTGSYGIFDRSSVSMNLRQLSYRNDVDIITELTVQIVPDEWVKELEKYVERNKMNIDMDTFREEGGFLLLHSHELSQEQQTEVDKVIGEGLKGTLFQSGGDEGKGFELTCSGYLDITKKGFPSLNMPWEGKNLNYIIINNNTARQLGITPYVYSISLDVSKQDEPEIKRKLQELLAEWNQGTESYTSYYLTAKSDLLAEEQSYIQAVRVVMGVFNGVLMLFAFLGYCNTVITGMVERRMEFAIMRSVGMTRKQLKEMLIWEGVFYSCCIMGLLFSLGNAILIILEFIVRKNILYFSYHFPALELLCFLILLLGISIVIPLAAYCGESTKSVIERLRNAVI